MPASLRIKKIRLRNYRCFERVEVQLDEAMTVLQADNGGGKTALLSGIAVALGAAVFEKSGNIKQSDVRSIIPDETLTAVSSYPCRVEAEGTFDGESLHWAREISRPDKRTTNAEAKAVRARIDKLWTQPQGSLPIVGFYGTQRLWGVVKGTEGKLNKSRREDAYVDALDPRSKEKQLMAWLVRASLAKLQRGSPSPEFVAVELALRTALRHASDDGEFAIDAIDFDAADFEPILFTQSGRRIRWSQLSDGEHVFAGLVADLARRCVTLNPHLGKNAVLGTSGVVLIDEVDLHLHPRWQRVVLSRLRTAFPEIQFVVSTHSPQVLSSVENHQVRTLVRGALATSAPVHGRDSNSILVEAFRTAARPDSQISKIASDLEQAVEDDRIAEAKVLLEQLRQEWGDLAPEVIRAERLLRASEAP
ncbi:MAG: AAA family ATPase [Archangium sp.]